MNTTSLDMEQTWYKLPTRIRNVCFRNRIRSIKELCNITYAELISKKGMGKETIEQIVNILNKNGLYPLFEHECKARQQDALKKSKKWIPCSERLPKEFGTYVVTIKMKYDHEKEYEWNVDVAYYEDGDWTTFNDWDEGQDEFDIIAWMPLPDPYKAGDSE